MRIALTHPLLAQHLARLDALAASDDAMLRPDRPAWMQTGTLATLRIALVRTNALPPAIREHTRPQSRILRIINNEGAEDRVRDFLARRVRYFMRREVASEELSLLFDRLRTVFRLLPGCIGMAALRAVAHACTTSRRMSH